MSRTEMRGAAQPERNARPARGRAARIAGHRGLLSPHPFAHGRGATPDGARAQRVVAPRRFATTDQPP
jgi:hypothetical protein